MLCDVDSSSLHVGKQTAVMLSPIAKHASDDCVLSIIAKNDMLNLEGMSHAAAHVHDGRRSFMMNGRLDACVPMLHP